MDQAPGIFLRGALAWFGGALVVTLLAWLVQRLLLSLPVWAALPLMALCLKPMLSWRMLHDEVQAVEAALSVSLEAGRERLKWLVSRDVMRLDAAGVRESAIETLAENLNDSVVAPLFWFALFGLPGAALYRFANTADAMWGYPGERGGRNWQWAGKWAARTDDLLNWVPARLTAALLLMPGMCGPCVSAAGSESGRMLPTSRHEPHVAAGIESGASSMSGSSRNGPRCAGGRHMWRLLRREADRTPSPNSGWPMAAMALRLGVSLGKPGVYRLNAHEPPPTAPHLPLALGHAARVVWQSGIIAALVSGAAGLA